MKSERSVQRAEFKFVAPDAGLDVRPGTFSGHGAVFGNVDALGDVIAKGAFRATLKTWGGQKKFPPMLLQHAGGMFGGSAADLVPIGIWTDMREDDEGLLVEGQLLALDTDRGKSVYQAMQAGALDGLSIGYIAQSVDYGKKPTDPVRTLKAVDLVEVSIVTFPANGDARIDAVKSAAGVTEREFERILRDAGFSRDEAKSVIADGYRALKRDVDAATGQGEMAAHVNGLTARLQALKE
jgi:HK97 family phage prohead protease